MKSFFAFIICLLFWPALANGQQLFSHLGLENGLSNNSVNTIYRDKFGFMWFGTDDGLNRYNGYEFDVYRNKLNDSTSLINNQVVGMAEDSGGRLWLATKRGAGIFDNISSSFSVPDYYPYKQKVRNKIQYEIYVIKAGPQGDIFMGMAGEGLMVYDHKNKITNQIPIFEPNGAVVKYSVASIVAAKNLLWLVSTGKGLYTYDYKSRQIRLVNTDMRNSNCMVDDGHGNLWIGTNNGLYSYNMATGATKLYRDGPGQLSALRIISLEMDVKRGLLIGTDGGGINTLNLATREFSYAYAKHENTVLTSNAVKAIYSDPQSRLWIGTLRGGINLMDEQKNQFKTISHNPLNKNSLANDFVLSFCEGANGDLWIGTDGGGISIWNRAANTYKNFVHDPKDDRSISNNNITSIVRDNDNTIWIATFGGGINKYNAETGAFEHYSCVNSSNTDNSVWKLYKDDENNIWAGTCFWRGLTYKLNRAAHKFEPFNEELNNVISINEDREGHLWFGTFNQLIRLDKKTGKLRYFNVEYPIRSIFEDHSGNLWIGTEYAGLLKFNPLKGDFTAFTESEGLSNNSVLNIQEDNSSNLWMSTYNGLSKFSYKNRSFSRFYMEDGLQSNQFNYNGSLKLSSGELLFGGIKGFNIFKPEDIRPNTIFPDLWITGLRVMNTPVTTAELNNVSDLYNAGNITLPYDKATISFSYSATEYTAATKIAYAYFLEGVDSKWNNVGSSRTASYSRLKEGSYTLKIKSTNAAGIWNKSERTVKILILPPWYRTWWAYLIYCCLVLGILYYINKYKSNQVRLRYEIELTTLNAERERELNEKKLSFFTNISHEFRTPLTLILNPLKELLYGKEKNMDMNDMSTVFLNAKRLLSLVDQLLLFRKTDHEAGYLKIVKLDIATVCKDVFLCFTNQAKLNNTEFYFECDPGMPEVYADREKVEIVLFNLISNAFKFTGEHGKIIFKVTESAAGIDIHIKDNGQGIPKEIGDKLFDKFYQVPDKNNLSQRGFGIGLYLAKRFVQLHQGDLGYESNLGEGTDFHIRLPKGKEHLTGQIIYEELSESTFLPEEFISTNNLKSEDQSWATENDNIDHLVSEQPVMLVIDDNADLRKYIIKLFKTSFTIYEAPNGDIGFKLAQKYVPDIVISDVTMPVLNGVELCTRIKADAYLNHIPVILLTSSTSSEIKLKGIECGADDYITKPFDAELFTARIFNILKSRSSLQKYFYNEITLQSDNQRISPEYKDFLNKCIALTEKHLDDPDFNAKVFAKEIGMSHSNLYKKVKSISGKSINEFIRYIRLRKAAEILINTECRVNEAAFQAGFNNLKYFRNQFSKVFEMTPSEFIKKYRKSFV
ncbi:MAG: hypothetical protein JWQ66_2348 [Mucilaginibacter sp.]|nr:hypothetical protein [Mucilaginibacter sp.]